MDSPLDCHASCPWRPLDWRWRRALQLADDRGRRPCSWDDELTGRALKYTRRFARCETPGQFDRLGNQMPDIAGAHRLHLRSDLSLWLIQARVLARLNTREIAPHASTAPEVIDCYEGLFFDIRSRLGARCCVHLQALKRPSMSHSPLGSLGWLLRTLAYHGGPRVLERAAMVLVGGGANATPHDASGPAGNPVSEQLEDRVRLLASLLLLPEDSPPKRVLDLMADLIKSTHMGGADSQTPLAAVCDPLLAQNLLPTGASPHTDTPSGPLETVVNPRRSVDLGAA